MLEKGEKEWLGEDCQKLYENTNPNVMDYKGLVRVVTSGATGRGKAAKSSTETPIRM
jgi:hypothetical protein